MGASKGNMRVDQAKILKALRQGNDQNIPWHRSTACKLLKEDITAGKNKMMKTRHLCSIREEYMAIDLKTFQNWICQEVDQALKVESRAHFGKKKVRHDLQYE